jgi:hypothetical protein
MSRFSNTSENQQLQDEGELEDTLPSLRLEDTDAQRPPGANPYETFPQVGKSNLHDRNAELRRLSAWIRQKRAAEELKASRETGEDED